MYPQEYIIYQTLAIINLNQAGTVYKNGSSFVF